MFWKQHLYTSAPKSTTAAHAGETGSARRGHAGRSHWISPSVFRRSVLSVTTSGTGLDQVSAGIRQGFRVSRTNSRKASEGVTEARHHPCRQRPWELTLSAPPRVSRMDEGGRKDRTCTPRRKLWKRKGSLILGSPFTGREISWDCEGVPEA